jgi:hypothetical protein
MTSWQRVLYTLQLAPKAVQNTRSQYQVLQVVKHLHVGKM